MGAQACAAFLGHRTPRVVLACSAALALYRLSEAAFGWEDVLGALAALQPAAAPPVPSLALPPSVGIAVAGGAVCLWLAQEWAIHARLLHSTQPWFGARLPVPAPDCHMPSQACPVSHCWTCGPMGCIDMHAGAAPAVAQHEALCWLHVHELHALARPYILYLIP